MKPKQAFKIVNGYFWDGIKDLDWNANLYDLGIVKNDRTKRSSEQRNKAHKAIRILRELVEGKQN